MIIITLGLFLLSDYVHGYIKSNSLIPKLHNNLKSKANSDNWVIIPDIWETLSIKVPNNKMLIDNIHESPKVITFAEANSYITCGAASFQKLGLQCGDCISIFGENSYRWFILDQSIMKAGGYNAVRGINTPIEEFQYIYNNSGSKGLIVENMELLHNLFQYNYKIHETFPHLNFIIVLYSENLNSLSIRQSIIDNVNSGSNIQSRSNMTTTTTATATATATSESRNGPTKDDFLTIESVLKLIPIYSYTDFITWSQPYEYKPFYKNSSTIATLVYTSGTTAQPKGVILQHKNLLHQVRKNTLSSKSLDDPVNPQVGDVYLSVLPIWHIFERICAYYILSRQATLVYSNIKNFKNDLMEYKPHYLIAVPRILETIQKGIVNNFKQQIGIKKKVIQAAQTVAKVYYHTVKIWSNRIGSNYKPFLLKRVIFGILAMILYVPHKLFDKLVWKQVRQGLGGRIKAIVSGGAALPRATDEFFEHCGINIINGYGLTETTAVIANRKIEQLVTGAAGTIIADTDVKIVDPETREILPRGKIGLMLVKGPSVTSGYMNNPIATHDAIDVFGYFNTGDLAKIDPATGALFITGRYKDAIVLSNGENISPEPIEQRILATSPIIDQVMLVGQDQKSLSALIVLNTYEMNKSLYNTMTTITSLTEGNNLSLSTTTSTTTTSSTSAEGKSTMSTITNRNLSSDSKMDKVIEKDMIEKDKRLQEQNDNIMKKTIRSILDQACSNSKPHERIIHFIVIKEPFTVANGLLTQTLKMKRTEIMKRYEKEIRDIYSPSTHYVHHSK